MPKPFGVTLHKRIRLRQNSAWTTSLVLYLRDVPLHPLELWCGHQQIPCPYAELVLTSGTDLNVLAHKINGNSLQKAVT